MKKLSILAAAAISAASCCGLKDGEYRLDLLTTNDIHGTYLDSTYVGDRTRPSMLAVNWYADSVRAADGRENVILLDNGDFLQGDNAAYFFNYIDTTSTHIFSRLADYMDYDVVVGGNHDIETGHPVYDRVAKELKKAGICFLAGNAVRNDNGSRYFPEYTILKKNGFRIAVLGYDNANIKAWLNESLWSGMHFESLIPLVQNDVDRIISAEKPDLVIVACHTGTGSGNGQVLESQGLDLFQSLKNVDVLVCAHDHREFTTQKDDNSMILINAGSHARNVGHGILNLTVKDGKVVAKNLEAELIRVDEKKTDARMREQFRSDYLKVKEFTCREVGELKVDFNNRECLTGMCDYLNFIHTVSISCAPAELSIAAPINSNGVIKAGKLIYNDLFTLYQYENQLFVVQFSGKEVKDYLEVSYDQWIQTATKPGDHVLNIGARPGPGPGMGGPGGPAGPGGPGGPGMAAPVRWSFRGATYNLDSMAGLNYTVDVTKPAGERITITTLANGEPFDMERTYNVAMTSYRASGGGDLLPKIGVDTDNIDDRVVMKYPEIRELMYEYLKEHGSIDPEVIGNPSVIGHWEFVPENIAGPGIAADMELLYGGDRRPR